LNTFVLSCQQLTGLLTNFLFSFGMGHATQAFSRAPRFAAVWNHPNAHFFEVLKLSFLSAAYGAAD
jgi:hypothetical protein